MTRAEQVPSAVNVEVGWGPRCTSFLLLSHRPPCPTCTSEGQLVEEDGSASALRGDSGNTKVFLKDCGQGTSQSVHFASKERSQLSGVHRTGSWAPTSGQS